MKQLIFILSVFCLSCTAVYAHKNDSTLQQYAGKYRFPEGSAVREITVTVEDGALVMTASMGSATLEKKGDDEFAIPSYNGTAVFKRNDSKKVISVRIDAQGMTLEGTKDDGDGLRRIEKLPEPLPLIPILEDEK